MTDPATTRKAVAATNGHEPDEFDRLKAAREAILALDEDGEPVPALDAARKALKLPQLARVIRYGQREPIFDLELLDGGRIPIGSLAKLRDPHHVADAIAEVTGQFPPYRGPKAFRPTANALLAVAELEDTHASPESDTRDWLDRFTSDRLPSRGFDLTDPERRETIIAEAHHAFRDTTGRLYIYLPAFERFMRTVERVPTTKRDLSARLRRLGFEDTQLEGPRDHDGRKPKRRYWFSPIDFDPES